MTRPNPFRADPTRTRTQQRLLEREIVRRLKKLRSEITNLVVVEDVFGLKEPLVDNSFCPTGKGDELRVTANAFCPGAGAKDNSCPPANKGGGRFVSGRSREQILKAALNKWKGSPTDIGLHLQDILQGKPMSRASMSGVEMREEAEVLLDEVLSKGVLAPTLYRGSGKNPFERKPGLIGWSEKRSVAKMWAKKYGGKVYTLEGAKGLKIQSIDPHKEAEWIVLHKIPSDFPLQVTQNAFCPGKGAKDNSCPPANKGRSDAEIARDASLPLSDRLDATRQELAKAAQEEYNSWEQDEEGMACEVGGGGICDSVAQRMQGVLADHGIDSVEGGQPGDDHAWLIAYTDDEAFGVDIPPGVYETGGGYNWKKLPDVTIGPDDV